MPLIYGFVARDSDILTEYTSSSGDFRQVTQAILEKIPQNDSKLSYIYDRYLIHYIREDGLTYMCIADDSFGQRISFAFLQDIKKRFLDTYSKERANTALPYGMNEFAKVIEKQIEHFSNKPNVDKINQVHGEIKQVMDIMANNIERVLERGERMEILIDKINNINQQTCSFRKRSTAIRVSQSSMWWKNTKLMMLLGFVIIIGGNNIKSRIFSNNFSIVRYFLNVKKNFC